MSKKRSDALTALIAEVVDIGREITRARANEDEARVDFTFARQQLDTRAAATEALVLREKATREALQIVQRRDEIADDVVDTLIERASR